MAETIKEEAKTMQKSYTYQDLLKFESAEIYSGFGKMRTSTRPTAPKYGFGTAHRDKQQKVFQSKEMAKLEFIGKQSPGPAYDVRGMDTFTYSKPAAWKMGTQERNTLDTGAKHDFYLRQDVDFKPDEADKVRRPKDPTVRMGLESRFPNEPKRHKGTPGPQYDPSLRPEIPAASKFSFGYRRELAGQSPLILNASTPALVGPGSYIQKDVPKTSKIVDEPKFSFPKGPKLGLTNPGWDKNQTYDTKRSIGPQINSKKKTLPAFSFGRSNRDAYFGTFKDMMATQPTQIRIQHPKY